MPYIYPNSSIEDLKSLKFYQRSNIQLDKMPRKNLFKDLDEIVLKEKKGIELRLYGFNDVWKDFEFIKDLKHLTNLRIDWAKVDNLEILNILNLKKLHLYHLENNPSILPIVKHKNLESLTLIGHYKNVNYLEELINLKELYISGVKIKNLNILLPLKKLEKLSISSCGNIDLGLISRLTNLKELNIGPFYQQTNLNFLSSLRNLETLRIDDLRNINKLPNLSKLTRLKNLEISYSNKLSDISALKQLKSIKEFRCIGCRSLLKEQFKIFTKPSPLKKIFLSGEKAYKRNEEIRFMLKDTKIYFMNHSDKAFK